jgi:hypothetical protein
MTIQARNLSAEQKRLLEDLLGHSLTEAETIHIRSVAPEPGPAWIQDFWPQTHASSNPKTSLALIQTQPFSYPLPTQHP